MIELPKSCGINLNLNNLGGELQAQISGYLNLDLGTPAGLASLKGTLEAGLSTITSKLTDLIPIPDLPNISLREELGSLLQLPFASTAAAAKIVELAGSFAGISNIAGFANLNLTDLAKSVFSISGTFDPCALLDGASLPNIMKDPVSGLLKKLPELPPLLGSTTEMLPIDLPIQDIQDKLQEAVKDNLPIVSTQAQSLLNNNIASMIPKIPQGLDNVIPGFKTFAGGQMPASVLQDPLGSLGGVLDGAGAGGLTGMLSGAVSSLTSQATSTASGLASGLSSLQSSAPGMINELAAAAPALLSELQAQAPAAMQQIKNEVLGAKSALGKNVMTSIGGMGDTIRKLPTGHEVVETVESYVSDFKETKKPILVEVDLYENDKYDSSFSQVLEPHLTKLNGEEAFAFLQHPVADAMGAKKILAFRKYHAESMRQYDNKRVDDYRAEHPEFDDPGSPDFHSYKGEKVEIQENHWNGKPQWRKAGSVGPKGVSAR